MIYPVADESLSLLEKGECRKSSQIEDRNSQDFLQEPPAPLFNSAARFTIGFLVTVLIIISWTLTWNTILRSSKTETKTSNTKICTSPAVRKEWRYLSIYEQQNFLSSLQCLKNKPSSLQNSTTNMKSRTKSTSRYDDFVWVHIQLYDKTHNVAPSLPWHRHFIRVFEKILQQECGYTGSLPYWDWTKDTVSQKNSPVWDDKSGFGGNGTAHGNCIDDGIFKPWKMQWPSEHCIRRRFDANISSVNYTTNFVQAIRKTSTSYHDFRNALESGPHKAIHNTIGGEMPTDHSPNGTSKNFVQGSGGD
jgi:hypothetical protein